VLLDQAIDRRGGAGDEPDAERAGKEHLRRHEARRREEHADHGGENDE